MTAYLKKYAVMFLFCISKCWNKMKQVLYIVRFTKSTKKVEKSLQIKWKNGKRMIKSRAVWG